MPRWIKFLILAAILLVAVAVPLAKQFSDGAIQGVVSDEVGPVPGAQIEARNVMSGEQMYATTDAKGTYRLERVRAGRYSLWVRAEGHSAVWVQRVVVAAGESVKQDVRLSRSPEKTFGRP